MAKKIIGYIKLQLPAGKATPAPPVGPALGAYGVPIPNFTKEFNERTKNDMGLIIPVVITRRRSYKEGLRNRDRFGYSEQDEGCDDHQGADRRDRKDEDARPQCGQP